MPSKAYYNEIDPFAAAWLRELIKKGHIADGDVDERSILDVNPDDLRGYIQCHFFAGIGVWSYALRQAGWPDDRPVWTGSCPCQPFSTAGKRAGFVDERHLWPAWHHLIRESAPATVFGEQAASKDGLAWLGLVQADLEEAGYANGAIDLCAAGVGAPHIRQRLWFVAKRMADADDEGPQRRNTLQERATQLSSWERSMASGMADADSQRRDGLNASIRGEQDCDAEIAWSSATGECGPRVNEERGDGLCASSSISAADRRTGPANGFWRDADWLFCRDGKWKPVEPGTFPLANGAAARVGRVRGFGNAIVAPAAQAFIEAAMECLP